MHRVWKPLITNSFRSRSQCLPDDLSAEQPGARMSTR